MKLSSPRFAASLAALSLCSAVLAPAFALQGEPKVDLTVPPGSKHEALARMRYLTEEIERLRGLGAPEREIAALDAHLDALSAGLGGDRPLLRSNSAPAATSASAAQALSAPACGNAALNTQNFAGSTGAIFPQTTPVTFTAVISGAGTYLWDLNLTTAITHANCADLDITLTSPAGTTIVITTDNGGTNDNVFNGTLWDDSGAGLLRAASDATYANNVTATPLHPEGRLSAFRGEDPNGTWTLTITDDDDVNAGALNSWSIDVTTIAAPVETVTNFTRSPGLVLTTSTGQSAVDSVVVAGLGTYLSKVTVYMEMPHTFAGDLDMMLTSPAGTQVRLTTDCGIGEDNVYNGTLFDPSSTLAASDYPFQDNVVAAVLAPEGAFDPLIGQNPNGTWTLTIIDDASQDGGTLVRWDLNITTIAPPTPSAPVNAIGTTGVVPDHSAGPAAPTIYTALVSGVGTYLWDVDLRTFIRHVSSGDVDMTLTSPAGTVVTITTDLGGTNDNVFNGTVWDDNASAVATDTTFVNLFPVATLSPEGRLGAFRGEDPNGVWTLSVTDDVPGVDDGVVDAWSLDVSALASAPTEVVTTLSQSPALVLASTGTTSAADTIAVAGLEPFVKEIEVYLEVSHVNSTDLDITLTSPSGTVVTLTTDNGGANDNVFNGTLFDSSSTDAITDHVFANNVVVPVIGPEGGLDRFVGEDPNGNWTLTVVDDLSGSGGTFVRWDLTVKTCAGAGSAFCSNGTLGIDHATPCPCGNTGAPGNGCGHSFDAGGANLQASGSSSADTVVLHSQFEPATSFTLFLQHALGGDTTFHDGVLCAGGTLIRLRGRGAVGGEAFFPNNAFPADATTTLSQRGGTFPGSGATRRYSAWFRNASTTFCPPATANISNGWVITW